MKFNLEHQPLDTLPSRCKQVVKHVMLPMASVLVHANKFHLVIDS